ncbi:MAG: alpha/beta hydrolase [Nitrososphaerota archaeon]|nr:alpha/beta hydrolase [Nitrososphaerota archaeon]
MPYTTLNGCRFYYETHGKGPPIVFIHGENQGPTIWEYQIGKFSKEYECITYYRRGHGKTELSEYGYSLENQTQDLAELMDFLQIKKSVLVSAAFGTTIATNFALTFPERTIGLVILGWSELDGARSNLEKWHKQTLEIVEALDTGGKDAIQELIRKKGKDIISILPNNPEVRKKFVELYVDRPRNGFFKRMEAVTSVPNLLSRFQELKVPILAVYGEEDHVQELSRFSNLMPNAYE